MLTQTTKKMESVTMSLVLWGFRARRTSELMRRAVPPMHTALAMASPNKRTKQSMAGQRTPEMLKLATKLVQLHWTTRACA